MHHLHPFFKTVLGKRLLGFMLSSTAKVKILPHHVYRSFEGKKLHIIFWEKSTPIRQKWDQNAQWYIEKNYHT